MAMYTSGASLVCQAGVGKLSVHYNRVAFGAAEGPAAGIRLQYTGESYHIEAGEDGSWGDWVPLLSSGNVSHDYIIDRLVVTSARHKGALLVHFAIGGNPEPPEHGSETETIVVGLGNCQVGSALVFAGTPIWVRVRELVGAKSGPKVAYLDAYMVLRAAPEGK